MDINELDLQAQKKKSMPKGLLLHEECYFIASRGIYSQFEHGEIDLEQAKREKAKIIRLYREGKIVEIEKPVAFNRKDVVEAVILELGRYMSCGESGVQREKAYPRKLFEKRIVQVIDKAYGLEV